MLVMVVQMANEAGVHDVSEGEDVEVEYKEWRDITWEGRVGCEYMGRVGNGGGRVSGWGIDHW